MNTTEIENIAIATAKWLSEKRRLGLEHVLSESHLIIPVAEHLIDQGWSDLWSERDSKTLFEIGNPGNVNYDIDAKKDGT